MHPRIFDIHIPLIGMSIPIYSYGFMMMLGFLAGLYIARERARREGVDPTFITDLCVILLLSGIVGARIAYVIEFYREFSWQVFYVMDGGWDILGGLLGAGTGASLGYYLPLSRKDTGRVLRVVVCAVLGGLIGARLIYAASHPEIYEGAFDVLKLHKGGLSFYGGLIMATAVGMWYMKKRKQRPLIVADITTPSLAIGLVFGRIGCFLNGCCFGTVTHSFVGFAFPGNGDVGGSPAWHHHHGLGLITFADPYSLPVHPTQIYHSIAALGIFILLTLFYRTRRVPGQVLLTFGTVYSLVRFLIEFLRDDMSRPMWGLTAYQILAIPIFIICTALLVRSRFANAVE